LGFCGVTGAPCGRRTGNAGRLQARDVAVCVRRTGNAGRLQARDRATAGPIPSFFIPSFRRSAVLSIGRSAVLSRLVPPFFRAF
jgi:hypothetical protein